MSTLTIPRPRVSPETDARVAAPIPAATVLERGDESQFATVFDLDFGQRRVDGAARIRRLRAAAPRQVPAPEPATEEARIRRVTAGPVRLTRRGRAVLVLGFLALALSLMIPLGGWATASLSGGSPEPVRVLVVQPGDTLYGIAGDLAEPGEVRSMVHRIQQLNSLPGGAIAEGQQLAVPVG